MSWFHHFDAFAKAGFQKINKLSFFDLMRKRVEKLPEKMKKQHSNGFIFQKKTRFCHCLIKISVANTKIDKNAKLVKKQF